MTKTVKKRIKVLYTKVYNEFYYLMAKSDVDDIQREDILRLLLAPRAALPDIFLWSNVAAETISNWLHKQRRIEKTIIKHVVKNPALDEKPLQNYFEGNRS